MLLLNGTGIYYNILYHIPDIRHIQHTIDITTASIGN